MKFLLCMLACACGDHRAAAIDGAAPSDAARACAGVFTGNFSETASTVAACATLDGGSFTLTLPAPSLTAGLVVAIPVTGDTATSQTATGWRVKATRMVDHDLCVLDAGDAVVPHGSFALALTSTNPPHGTLALDQPVRAAALAACGDPLTEHVEITF